MAQTPGASLDRPRGAHDRSHATSRQSSAARWLVIYAITAVVVITPLLMGSAPPWAQLFSTSLVWPIAVLFVVTRRSPIPIGAFSGAAALALAMTVIQLVPLPAALVRLLSPRALELRADAQGGAATFMPLTLDVPATILEVSKGMAYLALLVMVTATTGRMHRARPLIMALAFMGAGMSAIHVIQRALGAHSILGVFAIHELPGAGFFGTFVNGNHAASLLALSALIAAGVALDSGGVLRIAATISAIASVATVLATGSRAGVIGLAIGASAFATLVLARRYGWQRGALLVGAFIVVLGVGASATIDDLNGRIARMGTAPRNLQKVRGWQDSMRIVGAYPWTGVGRGAFEAPATGYRSHSDGVRLAFPENVILQMTTEWGVPLALFVGALALIGASKVVPLVPKLESPIQGAACGVLAVVSHELADFGLELPGVAIPTIVALGLVAARVREHAPGDSEQWAGIRRRWVAGPLAGWAMAAVAGIWAVPRTLAAEGARLKVAVAEGRPGAEADIAAAIRRHPADYYLALLAAADAQTRSAATVGKHLNRALRLHPADPTAHLGTARWLVARRLRSQAALEYRLAAERGAPAGYDELFAAVGKEFVADAVPQTPAYLLEAAHRLIINGHVAEAERASAHAVGMSSGNEAAFVKRVELALQSRSPAFIAGAASDLLRIARHPASFVTAAQALTVAGDTAGADRAIQRGLGSHSQSGVLVVAGARLRAERGDLDGAATLLKGARDIVYTLEERRQGEELWATIAEKRGDTVGAAAARARAAALARTAATSGR